MPLKTSLHTLSLIFNNIQLSYRNQTLRNCSSFNSQLRPKLLHCDHSNIKYYYLLDYKILSIILLYSLLILRIFHSNNSNYQQIFYSNQITILSLNFLGLQLQQKWLIDYQQYFYRPHSIKLNRSINKCLLSLQSLIQENPSSFNPTYSKILFSPIYQPYIYKIHSKQTVLGNGYLLLHKSIQFSWLRREQKIMSHPKTTRFFFNQILLKPIKFLISFGSFPNKQDFQLTTYLSLLNYGVQNNNHQCRVILSGIQY
ncbi:hypothetical protein FGO68_gene15007 [Halteria grandinella]|uniref:Transmembrane protein n=1 Tax=Halteria grandinella TaxID=5974 RepID=A0A8J8SY59_HALGN|nr:hypothetical protein FGO68_gene15007 [Halteria grandinella]